MNDEAFDAALVVLDALNEIGAPAFVGGSLASTIFGTPRSTIDADLVAHMRPGQVETLIRKLGAEFYASTDAIKSAVENRSCFNVIHLATMMKVDVFVAKDREFDRVQLARIVRKTIHPDSERQVAFSSPEDVILAKLEWYRLGDEVSDRQWLDVLGVLKVMADELDFEYLTTWAKRLGVADLLDRARTAAG